MRRSSRISAERTEWLYFLAFNGSFEAAALWLNNPIWAAFQAIGVIVSIYGLAVSE